MKVFVFLICFVVSLTFATNQNNGATEKYEVITEQNFTTRLDHFRPKNDRKLSFKYYANMFNYKEGGPVYIYLGDSPKPVTKWIENSLMVDIARYEGGALFTYERRYFGKNVPTETATLKDLDYLTLDQVLADVAVFIATIKQEYHLPGNVLVFGSGIGAFLAVAARQKYPHLVTAAWASSGVFEFDVNTYKPFDVLETVIVKGGDIQCETNVKSIFEIMDFLLANNEGEYLRTRFNLCSPVQNTTKDVAAFLDAQLSFIIDYFSEHHFNGVEDFCKAINSHDPLNAYARWVRFVYGDVNDECLDLSYASILKLNGDSAWHTNGTRQDYYWQCTQLGNFAVTDRFTWLPNRVNSSYRAELCQDLFGAEYNFEQLSAAIGALKVQYGNLKRVRNVIYTNGGMDVWHFGGVQMPGNKDVVVIDIPTYGKSADLTPIAEHDSATLRQAKQKIMETIRKWSK